MSKAKRPWMKWYPADWRSEPGLRMCGFAARGLWADLIALMHEAEPYGCLLVNGRAPSAQQLAAMLGGTVKQIETLLSELETAGVFSRDDEGVIFCRRMIRDHAASVEGRAWVEKRWANGDPTPSPNRDPNRGATLTPITQKPEARSQIPENPVEATQASPPQPRRRGTRLPDDWSPTPDDLAFAEQHGWSGDPLTTEVLKFRNYWTSKSGAGATKLDWHRTFCNWLLTARRPGQAPPGQASKAQSAEALISEIH